MVTCRDVNNLDLDGVELLTGEVGLDRVVSWTYFVQTKPYEDHMNPGNFALIVVDYLRFDIEKTFETMVELNALGISGLAISIVDDREKIPQKMIDKAVELKLPLFLPKSISCVYLTSRKQELTCGASQCLSRASARCARTDMKQ